MTGNWIRRDPEFLGSLEEVIERLRTPACHALVDGYRELLADSGGTVPSKNGLDIARFAKALPHLVLCAVTLPDRCVYRLAGEVMKHRVGLNPIGRNYYDFVPPERRSHAQRAMNMVVEIPCAFRAEIEQQYSGSKSRLIEALALPLVSEETGVDGFILFGDCEIDADFGQVPEETTLLGANVVERQLIDLGHGVDRTFSDIVLSPDP